MSVFLNTLDKLFTRLDFIQMQDLRCQNCSSMEFRREQPPANQIILDLPQGCEQCANTGLTPIPACELNAEYLRGLNIKENLETCLTFPSSP